MSKKARPTVPLHFLDHMIIPIDVGDTHSFPAHVDIEERQMTSLDSLHSCSSKCHARHVMLIWKFSHMAWYRHLAKEFSPPNWFLSPVEFTQPDTWLPEITPVMAQVLKKRSKAYSTIISKVLSTFIIKKWKCQSICV